MAVQDISVTVSNQNEVPEITSDLNITVQEESSHLGSVIAIDSDGESVTYSISGGDAPLFIIDGQTGELSFRDAPDFENPADADGNNVYEFQVTVTDGQDSITETVTVTVTNRNESPIIESDAAITLVENRSVVMNADAYDGDGDALNYSLEGSDAALFTISGTGELSFIEAPDYENPADIDENNIYDVTIVVTDGSNIVRHDVQIIVADRNEAPVLTGTDSFTLSENSRVAGQLLVADDEADLLAYSIAAGGDGAFFTINASGELSFRNAPDFENPSDANGDNIYELTVSVSDGKGGVTAVPVSVAVTGVNEAPVIISNSSISLQEGQAAALDVNATDADSGDILVYTIVAGGDGALFTIDEVTGELSFKTAPNYDAPQDADGNNVYELTVRVSDGNGESDEQAVTVEVTDVNNSPVITSDAAITLAENEVAVTSVTASDADGDTLTYALSGPDSAQFTINANTGELSFVTAPDYENPADANGDNVYELIVLVNDGDVTVEQDVTVTVSNLNDAPEIGGDGTFTLAEGVTLAGVVGASDDDDGDTLSFSLTGGADAALFTIDGSSGELRFVAAPDYEAPGDDDGDNVYEVEVTVSDGTVSTIRQMRVTVSDSNDLPQITSGAAVTVEENRSSVSVATASDADGDTLAWSIAGGVDGALFAIDETTGALRFIAAPDFEAPADFDGDNVYEVVLEVSDGNGGTASQTVLVTVSDANEAPTATGSAAVTLAENQSLATVIAASDVDGDTLTYAIAGGADAGLFTIDGSSGELRFVAAPDYESPADADGDNVYEVLVEVSDGNGGTVTQSVSVTVTDSNEAPVIESGGAISLGEGRMAVVTLAASDSDGDVLNWSITGGVDASLFVIDETTGALRFVDAPDYEAPADSDGDNVYELSVTVSDGNGKSVTEAVTVTITDKNEAPVITSDAGVTIVENRADVMSVEASDGDGDTLTYAIAGGVDAALFTIDGSTGALRFVSAPDYEAPGDADEDNVYRLKVSVSDGTSTSTQDVLVTVNDKNEAPVVTSDAAITLAENRTLVTTLDAADDDGDVLTWSITGGVDAGLFTIDASSGELRFVSAPDYEAPGDDDGDNVYELEVTVSDGTVVTSETITVTLSDANEAPVITGALDVTLAEDDVTPVTIAASDPDGDTLVWSIAGGVDAGLFTIDAGTGAISFVSAPDYGSPADADGDNVYELNVTVSDGNGKSVTEAVTITVTDTNEAPVITSGDTITLGENVTAVLSVTASDADGDALTYAIAGGADGALFTIDATGALAFRDAPDFEAPGDADGDNVYEVIVSVFDGVSTVQQNVTVSVTDSNDAPEIGGDGTFTLAEGVTLAGVVGASDDDDGDTLSFSLTGGADAALFTIDGSSGELRFVAAPDYEAPGDDDGDNVYEVEVTVSDGTVSTIRQMRVTVSDSNDLPQITSGAAVTVEENRSSVSVATASDADGDTLAWSIAGGVDGALFAIDETTGALRFIAAPDFEAPADFDGDNVYEVVLEVSDGNGGTASQTVLVTVSDANEGPFISSTDSFSVRENELGAFLVEATDDEGDTLSWTIVGGADRDSFVIDGSTGAVSFVSEPDFENPDDFDGDNIYEIIVEVSDGTRTTQQAISVAVTDENDVPVITSESAFTIQEERQAITAVEASDDDGDALIYEIVGGVDFRLFTIDNETGALSFIAPPDFENPEDFNQDNVYEVRVQVDDGNGGSVLQNITVTVLNENDAPVIISQAAITMAENSVNVSTIEAVDTDPADDLIYAIAGGADAALFTIDGTTGELAFITPPDFETPADDDGDNIYQLTVSVNDGTHVVTQDVTITITDANDPPVISSDAVVTLREGDTVVTTVAAADPDDDAASLVYGIASGYDGALFTIDAGTGELSLITPPDFENPSDADGDNIYEVMVTVTDGSNIVEQLIEVTVSNENEVPVISSDSSITIAENEKIAAVVEASDPDGDALVYGIAGGDDASLFAIDADTGELTFITAPDFEAPGDADGDNIYVLTVSVFDGSETVIQDVTITVTDANDPPLITSEADISLNENITSVSTVAASDIDDDVSTLVYALAGGDDVSLFTIDAATGELSFITAPDFENPTDANGDNVYQLIVSVSDGLNTTEQEVTVTITDANDAPVITSDADVTLAEDEAASFDMVADDDDGDTLSYAIIAGDDAALFTIDAVTGEVSFITAPDFEAPADSDGDNVYEIIVEVDDGVASVQQAVTITVTDANEAPVITSDAAITLAEAETEVVQVTSEDADTDDTLTYAIAGGADSALFVIDAQTGELSFISVPDFENPSDADTDNVYEVTVSVSDGTDITEQNVTVTITDSNDPPVFSSSDAVSSAENETVVTTIAATDPNSDVISYSIVGGADKDLFVINAITGEVSFLTAPDFENPGDADGNNIYEIIVEADDGLKGTQQALTITITDAQDAPVIDSEAILDLAENETTLQIEARDDDGDTLVYAIAGGADSALFSIDATTGELSFVAAPDFENPGDADGDNLYDLLIEVSDGTDIVQKAISINVTDAVEGIDTSILAETQGFIIQGDTIDDGTGYSVSSLGDVNGDGYDDLLVGANYGDDGGLNAGETYVIFGQSGGIGTLLAGRRILDLTTLTPAQGFIIQGDMAGDQLGYSVSDAGDVNGDGFADIIVGAYQGDDGGVDAGEAYVVFGNASGFGELTGTRRVLDLTTLSEAQGFIIQGDTGGDTLGFSVSSAGDINGDGYDDLIVGARGGDDGGSNAGEAYVVFGSAALMGDEESGRKVIDVTTLTASEGFIIEGGANGDRLGYSVSSAGDFNGDGYDDLLISANYGDDTGVDGGQTYIVYGTDSGFGIDVSGRQVLRVGSLTSDLGLVLQGDAAMQAGMSVSDAGDVNSDGYDDVIVGAKGGAYVVFGRKNGSGSVTLDANGRQTIGLGSMLAAEGFLLTGTGDDGLGYAVSSGGDVNGDGFADLIVGTYLADSDGVDSGTAYVLFGSDQGFGTAIDGQQVVDVTSLSSDQGFAILGDVAGDGLGRAVSSAGDINGDGYSDIVVGAYLGDDGGSNAGEAYVIYGSAEMGAQGEQAAQSLTGTVSADILIGGNGDDVITGGGGLDVIRAGAGDDRITLTDFTFEDIHGGRGFDSLVLDGAGLNFDLTAILPGDLRSVEAIDLTGSGDNVLTISGENLLDISDWRMDGEAYMLVTGDAGDSVVTQGFTYGGTQIYEGVTYNLYERGYANLLVAQDVAVANNAAGIAPVIDTSILKEHYGFIVQGDEADDRLGYRSMQNMGDVNGDGYDDWIVGAYQNDEGGTNTGAAYVLFGGAGGFGTPDATGRRVIDLSSLSASQGFAILGENTDDYLGYSVSSAGDVNGDGYADVIVGAYRNDEGGGYAGAAYVLFGKASGFGTVDLGSGLSASDGFKIIGDASGDSLGYSVSSAGDVNGDGYDDLIVGAYYNDDGGTNTGTAYVLFGKASGFGTVDTSSSLSASDGFKIYGDNDSDYLGQSVSSAGDVNGDGYADVIVGAYGNDAGGSAAGAAYVLFGKASGFGTVDLGSGLSASDGFKITGDASNDYLGMSVSSAGDVNGDGYADVIVGAYANDDGGSDDEGAAYVIFGKASGFGTVDLGSGLSASDGFKIMGAAVDDYLGYSVSSAGDVNGDGYADLIIGAYQNDAGGSDAGAAYVIFGKASGFGTVDLDTLTAADGFIIQGDMAGDNLGRTVSSAGDIDGDGYDDLLVGAFYGDDGGEDAGEVYVLYGSALYGQQGEQEGRYLNGMVTSDVLVGGNGDDTLIGAGGADSLHGGAGDDLITVADLSFLEIDGGRGMDTLGVTASGATLDLTTTLPAKIQSVEVIDLTGTGNNTLIVDAASVFDVSGWRMGGEAWMIVEGNAGDTVTATGFTANGTYVNDGVTYNLYESGNANLLVSQDMAATLASMAPVAASADAYGLSVEDYSTDTAADLDAPVEDQAVLAGFSSALDMGSPASVMPGDQPAATGDPATDTHMDTDLAGLHDPSHTDDIVS
ncbi:cadherin domain-containing protein [Altericroceibacterium spongiae]|nr:cadherin domain-containing protein [Altericroceibacterium spongiae]